MVLVRFFLLFFRFFVCQCFRVEALARLALPLAVHSADGRITIGSLNSKRTIHDYSVDAAAAFVSARFSRKMARL